jgi:hypothetical protein
LARLSPSSSPPPLSWPRPSPPCHLAAPCRLPA